MGFLRFSGGGGAVVLPAPATASETEALPWSDPATWGGTRPGPKDVAKVPAGRTVLIDQDVDVAALEVSGTVLFAARDIHFRANGILVSGPGPCVPAMPSARLSIG